MRNHSVALSTSASLAAAASVAYGMMNGVSSSIGPSALMALSVGASFTGVMVIERVAPPDETAPLSVTVKVMVRVSGVGASLRFWYVTARSADWKLLTPAGPVKVRTPPLQLPVMP